MAKHKKLNSSSPLTNRHPGNAAGKSPQTAIATPPAAGRSARLAFSPVMRDALSFPTPKRLMTPMEVREAYGPAKTLGAPEGVRMAMDNALDQAGFYSLLQHGLDMGVYGGMANFMGYAALQNIAQNGLVRACIETVSDDMTRNWIEISRDAEDKTDNDKDGKDDVIDAINAEVERLELQKVFHEACSMTGYYGGCLIYLDTGASGEYLRHPLNLDPLFSMEARNPGFLQAVRCIDPINVFPGTYNATNPLANDYYRPHTWWVLGQEVHASRLLRIVANEAPLIFKPSYNFLGIPQAQILWDYVLHFQQNRDAANRLLNKFSMLVFKTAMGDILMNEGGIDQLDTRMQLLARNQSNDGVFAIDRESEDVAKVETPLGGVTDIVKQSLEQLAALNRTPAVKLLGISPSGFNATGESDIRNYYDHVLSQQEKVLRHAIKDVLDVIQISLFGKVDSSISFTFRPLSEDDKSATAATQQVKVNTICSLLERDIISPEEARRALIADPASGFNDLDPDDVPEPRDEQGMGGMPGMPGMGGGAPEQTPEGQVAEEDDEISLGRKLLGMDAELEGKVQWRSLENGQPFPIKKGESVKEAAEKFIAKKKAEEKSSSSSSSSSTSSSSSKSGSTSSGKKYKATSDHAEIKKALKSGVGKTNTSDSNGADSLAKHRDADGNLTPEREKLHEEIVLKHFEGVEKPDGQPVYTFLGGGSASGKTSATNSGLFHYRQGAEAVTIDADAIKKLLPEYNEMVARGDDKAAAFVHEESSALAKRISAIAAENGFNVSLDGTGDGSVKSMLKKIQQAKDAGMRVEGYYVTVPTRVAQQRAKARAIKTGRKVPLAQIKNIHQKVSEILPQIADKFDHIELYENTYKPVKIMSGEGGKIQVHNENLYDNFLKKASK